MINDKDILRGKILIVDDLESNVLLLRKMLQGAGYQSIASTMDSSEVCELHLRNHYDLILLDLQMPGMDGFQVMENLKEIEAGSYLPVLVITAQPDHKLRALKAGAKDFVSKPLDFAEVLIRVHNMLEVRLLHQETKTLYASVVAEQKASNILRSNLINDNIDKLLGGHQEVGAGSSDEVIMQSYAEATVLFASALEFARFSEGAAAKVLEGVLDNIAAKFDAASELPGPQRSRVVGEASLAAVGLPDDLANRTMIATQKALDLAQALGRFNASSRFKLRFEVGMEAATGVAGKVTKRKILREI